MIILFIILLFQSIIYIGNVHGNEDWSGERWLHQNYMFKWKTDAFEKVLTIRIEVQTKGWVGFGFSAHGKFKEADMVYGWVTDQGQSFFNDFWIDENQTLSLDKSQDWYLKSGTENGTHTIFEFSRKYVTCDSLNDLEIYENEYEFLNIMWAYSLSDPQSAETIGEPQLQGHLQFNLFRTNFEPKESDLQVFDQWMNFTADSYEQNYYCKIIKVPWTEKRHIVKFQNVFIPNPKHIHVILHRCANKQVHDKYLGKVFPCYDNVNGRLYSNSPCENRLLQTSELDGVSITLPHNIGIAIDPAIEPFFVMTALFKPAKNIRTYSLAIRLFTTRTLRMFESDLIHFGNSGGIGLSSVGMYFPPLNHPFRHVSLINFYCLNEGHFENGIFIYAIMFHSHFARKMEVRHYRDDKLIRSLEYNNYYRDRHPISILNKPVNFRTGDKMAVICLYNAMNISQVNMLNVESCFTASYYYPRIPSMSYLMAYFSGITYETMLKITGLQEINGYNTIELFDEIFIKRPAQYNGTKLIDFIKQNKYQVDDPIQLEEILISSDKRVCCLDNDDVRNHTNEYTKHCASVKSPPGLYQSIVNERKQNYCPIDKRRTPGPFANYNEQDKKLESFEKIQVSLKFLMNALKVYFDFQIK